MRDKIIKNNRVSFDYPTQIFFTWVGQCNKEMQLTAHLPCRSIGDHRSVRRRNISSFLVDVELLTIVVVQFRNADWPVILPNFHHVCLAVSS